MKDIRVFALIFAVVLYLGVIPGIAAQGGLGSGKGGAGRRHGTPSIHGQKQLHTGERPPHVKKSYGKDVGRHASGKHSKKTVGELLTQNTKLSSRLQEHLPPSTSPQEASEGFEHLGQFVAAVHASRNLGLPFDQLKQKLVGPSPKSLGQAIHELRPGVNARKEAKRANEQALEVMEKSLPH